MTDWQTMKQQLSEEVRKTGTPDADKISRAIVESVRFNRAHHFYFNEGRGGFTTIRDHYDYNLPGDFINLIGRAFYSPVATPEVKVPLQNRTADWAETARYLGDGLEPGSINSGQPRSYAIYSNRMLLVPVPTTTGEAISFRYVRDLGTPSFRYNGTAWAFNDPAGAPITATYSNAWFVDGYALTLTRALHYLWSRVYAGEAQATNNAQAALVNWLEEEARLRRETTKKKSNRSVSMHL